MIKAIAFDFDGVVYKNGQRVSERLIKDYQIPLERVLPFFKNALGLCQKGEVDMKKVLEEKYFEIWGWDKSFEEFIKYWLNDGGKLDYQVLRLISGLKERNIKVYLISNNEKYRMEALRNKLDLDEIFDSLILSYEVGSVKPRKKIFQHLISLSQTKPEEILFISDEVDDFAGAKQLGINVLEYKGINRLKNYINKFDKQ